MTPKHLNDDRIPVSVRRRAYPVALAVIAVLVAYGVLDGEHAAAWSNLAAAIVGAATAGLGTAYRPTTPQEEPH